MYDLIIKNGKIVSTEKTYTADIGIKNEKIMKIGSIETNHKGSKVINAKGKHVIPGIIDGHMHVEAPMGGVMSADDYFTQSITAAHGGVTTFIDFTNTNKGDSLVKSLHERIDEMKKASIDFSLHGRIVDVNDDILEELPKLVEEGCPSFKMYMTYKEDGLKVEDINIMKVFEKAREVGALSMIHCESDDIYEYNKSKAEEKGNFDWYVHAEVKPPICEFDAAMRVMNYSRIVGNALLLVHTSSIEILDVVKRYHKDKLPIYLETCPHYLTIYKDIYKKEDGHLAICSPPLRSEKESKELWKSMDSGNISITGSDDCSFTRQDKEKFLERDGEGKIIQDYRKVVNGMSGIEMRLPILLSEGVNKNRITMEKLVSLTSTNLAKLFGMYPQKGVIQEGSDADLVIVDLNKTKTVSIENLHNNVGYTPYEGLKIKGLPIITISRGKIIVKDGQFLGVRGRGKFIKRKIRKEILEKFNL